MEIDASPFFPGGLPAVGFTLRTRKHQRLETFWPAPPNGTTFE